MNDLNVEEDPVRFLVKDILMYKLGLEDYQLTESADLQDDLGIDSLDMIELQMEFEKKLNIHISDEEGEKLRTVGNIIHFLKNKIRL
jgi:acyl carrier protein